MVIAADFRAGVLDLINWFFVRFMAWQMLPQLWYLKNISIPIAPRLVRPKRDSLQFIEGSVRR